MVNSLPAMGRPRFDPWVWNMLRRRKWQPTSVFLPGKIPRMEEPGGLYSPWGHKELDMTEQLTFSHFHSFIFGCAGSSLLCMDFFELQRAGTTL